MSEGLFNGQGDANHKGWNKGSSKETTRRKQKGPRDFSRGPLIIAISGSHFSEILDISNQLAGVVSATCTGVVAPVLPARSATKVTLLTSATVLTEGTIVPFVVARTMNAPANL